MQVGKSRMLIVSRLGKSRLYDAELGWSAMQRLVRKADETVGDPRPNSRISNFYSVTGMLILKRGGSRIRGPKYDGRISKGRKCVGKCMGRWTRDEADAMKLGGDT